MRIIILALVLLPTLATAQQPTAEQLLGTTIGNLAVENARLMVELQRLRAELQALREKSELDPLKKPKEGAGQ